MNSCVNENNLVLDNRDFDAIEDRLRKSVYSLHSHVVTENGVMSAMYHEFADGTGEFAEVFHTWPEFIEAEQWMANEMGVQEINHPDNALELWGYVRWQKEYTFFIVKDITGFRANFTGDSWKVDPSAFLNDIPKWLRIAHEKEIE